MKDDQCPVEAVQEISVKLHNVLLSLTTGEANAAIRRCRGNGLWAWKKLSATLNPRTLASGVKAISQVLNPDTITNAPKADSMIDAWEDKMAKLSAEYGEVISAKVKVAVLYAMLPKHLQKKILDKCAVNWDGAKESEAVVIYGKVKEEAKNIAKSRREMITPKPMEVDRVQTDWAWWNDEAKETENYEEDVETDENHINYVGKGKGKGKGNGECWAFHCPLLPLPPFPYQPPLLHSAARWPTSPHANKKCDGKGSKDGWTAPMVRACFGCGSTKVQEVREEMEEPEILFIGHTAIVEDHESWQEVSPRRNTCKGVRCSMPPCLDEDEPIVSGFFARMRTMMKTRR